MTTLHLEVPSRGLTLTLARVDGRERIGALFDFELLVVAKEANVGADDLLSQEAQLVFVRTEEGHETEVRRMGGVLVEVEDLFESETDDARFRVRFAPRIFRWSLRETTEIYLDASLPDLLAQRLDALGLARDTDYELRLDAKYEKREFVVQYKETDLAFVSRVCEHYGVSFFFEHREGRDVVVFTDVITGFTDDRSPPTVEFRARGEHVDVWKIGATTKEIPARYLVADYNYRLPGVDLTGETNIDVGVDGGEVYEYGAHHKTPDEGKKLARIRAEERVSQRRIYEGLSDSALFSAGRYVTIEGHARGDVPLLVTEVTHHATQTVGNERGEGRAYMNDFRGVKRGVPYRPARMTPKPRVAGVLTAQIDAENPGKFAELDEDGRYKVRFLFDQSENPKGKSSRPVRMMQPHAGPGYGMHFPLRPGIEVALVCIDGDPDRPIIVGTVPNPTTTSPVTSDNGARNIIKTGGGNEINISDEDDKHRIKMTTPHLSTTFQLGAPNAEEAGALVSTLGASSTLATGGVTAISSLGTTFDLLGKLTSAGDISSIAEKPGAAATFATFVDLLDTMAGMAAGGIDIYLTSRAAKIANKQDEATKKQKAAAAAQAKHDAARAEMQKQMNDFATAAPQPIPASDPRTPVVKAYADYKAALDQLATDITTQQTAQLDYDDTVRRNVVPNDSGGGYTLDGSVAYKRQVLDAANATVAADRKAVDGVEESGDPAGTDKLKAYRDAVTAYGTATGATDANIAKLASATTAQQQYDTTAPDADRANTEAYNANKSVLDDQFDLNDSPSAKKLAAARVEIDLARTGKSLISAICAIINFFVSLKEKVKGIEHWMEAEHSILAANPRTYPGHTLDYGPTSYALDTMHTIGSEQGTTIYADQKALITAPVITMFANSPLPAPAPTGMFAKFKKTPKPPPSDAGRVTIVGEKRVVIASKDTAEMSSAKKSVVSSMTDVEITAGNAIPLSPGKLTAVAQNQVMISSAKDDVLVKATAVGKKIDLTAEAEIKAETKTITLDAATAVAIKAKDPAGKVTIDGGANGAVTIVVGNYTVEVKPTGVTVGNKSGPPVVKITPQEISATLNGSSSLKLGPGGVTLEGVGGKVQLRGGTAQVSGSKVLLGV